MFEFIEQLIMRHTAIMDQVLSATIHIVECTQKESIKEIENSTQNRERLINQLAELQGKIETLIENLIAKEMNQTNISIIKAWLEDLSIWSITIQKIDQYLIDSLNHKKNKTSKEIATLFESKSKLKGYNLNNVSK